MSPLAIFVVLVITAVVIWVPLEGRRQKRRLEEMGQAANIGGGGDMLGAGLLQLQSLLQADRKIEVIREAERDHHDDVNPAGGRPLPPQPRPPAAQ